MPAAPRLVDSATLASRLGVHKITVGRWVAAGLIAAPVRVGGAHVWSEATAARIVDRHRRRVDPASPSTPPATT